MHWEGRYEAYRSSPGHASGDDLDLLVAWCEPGPGVRALDVATGGGHVADRLRAAGSTVTTCDAEPSMRPDVVCPADALPFEDGAFEVVASRIAAHHFPSIPAAVSEMARVAAGRVVIEDTLFLSDAHERAERLRDPSHVRSFSADEWEAAFTAAGMQVTESTLIEKRHDVDAWLKRSDCVGETAAEVRRLLADSTADGVYTDTKIILRAEPL
jgi:SAM-dependent methyltransferase